MKLQRKTMIVIGIILGLALIGTTVWGFQERKGKNELYQRAENHYQRAFHTLSFHVDQLEDELGKTLALDSKRELSTSLINAWRLSYAAQEDISQLPLTDVPFDDVEGFLSQTGTFAYQTSVRDLNKAPLSEAEYAKLTTLYKRAGQIQDRIMEVQSKMLQNPLRWMDAEEALDQSRKNQIVDGVRGVNQMVKSYPDIDFGRTVNNAEVSKREKIAKLKGKEVSASGAKNAAKDFLGLHSTENLSVERNNGGDYKTYSVHYRDPNGVHKDLDVTVIGGHVVWMVGDRNVRTRKLDVTEAAVKGKQFLERIKEKNMVANSYSEAGNTVTVTYINREKGIYIYPETVAVKIALDNGEILGYDGDEFLFNQISLSQTRPIITLEQAKKQINPHLHIRTTRLAVIYNKEGEKKLCYEIVGFLSKGDEYRLFIDANTGKEELIEKIKIPSKSR